MSKVINIILLTIVVGTIYEPLARGGDFDNYRNLFNSIEYGSEKTIESGFYYLNLIIKQFTQDYTIAYFIFSLIVNILVVNTIYRYSKNIEFSLLMYVIMGGYFSVSNITRQMIAISIMAYAIKYIIQNNKIKYIILTIIASQFHITSLVIGIIVLLIKKYNTTISNNYFKYIVFLNLVIFIEPIIRQIGINLFFEQYDNDSFSYGSSILHYIVQIAFISLYLLRIKKVKDENDKFFINISTIAMCFILMSQRFVLYSRIALYFNVFYTIAIPNVLININNKKEKRLIIYCVIMGLGIYYILLTSKSFIFESHIIDYFRSVVYI